jgi:hypothetical protein
VSFPITKLQCSPTSNGAAAAIICSEDFVRKHKLEGQAVSTPRLVCRTESRRSGTRLSTADNTDCTHSYTRRDRQMCYLVRIDAVRTCGQVEMICQSIETEYVVRCTPCARSIAATAHGRWRSSANR